VSYGHIVHGHCTSLKTYKESDQNYDRVLDPKPGYRLAKDNQKIVKKKLSKHKTIKTHSFE
jgi:hypothetical protein